MSFFEVTRPTADPYRAGPGPVLLKVTIKPLITGSFRVRLAIYEGSFWGGYGTWIASYDQSVYFTEGVITEVQFMHNSVWSSQERRDVRVEISGYFPREILFDSGDKSDWDDVFYVIQPSVPPLVDVDVVLGTPTANPYEAPPGLVSITTPITLAGAVPVTVMAKLSIYEGSFLPTHGTKLWEASRNINLSPWQPQMIEWSRSSVVGTIDRRDVRLEIYYQSERIADKEWDDVFYVTQPSEPPPPLPPPPDDEEPPPPLEEVKKIPWVPIALIGLGAGAIAIVATRKNKT